MKGDVAYVKYFSIGWDLAPKYCNKNSSDILKHSLGKDLVKTVVAVLEPALFQNEHGFSVFTGEKIAQDYVLLKNILAKYPLFNATRVVGPSSVMIYNTDIYKE